ncbi:unnamed protein product [Miscanthus lutarioriparius]|uniref:DC1 domain-containing protein n=1 Tax=Miscanthus lutarioriparius TaxID=422564 RepID=A0A811Q1C0_9POAL|nr:unnamed protein product [Miscanthus lutarioriparius]
MEEGPSVDFCGPGVLPWKACKACKGMVGRVYKEALGSSNKDPPSYFSTAELGTSEIWHPARPEHKLKLMTDAGAPFLCDGCKEPGYGPRYRCDYGGGQSLDDLHTRCALAGDPLVHPLFGYGKQFEFRFLHEAPSSPVHEGRRNEGQRRWFWAYRCDVDGEAVDLHVACLKETARRSWEASNRNQDDVGGGALNVDHMLENMLGEIAGTVASFITALVFGNLSAKM